jgi:hypothetical protein
MSKYNALANEDKYRAVVRAWLRETSPLVYLFAPSNEGKTTLLGSLFPRDPGSKLPLWTYDHDDYCKVLYIDADQGGTTIEHLLADERLCDYREFDQPAAQLLMWVYAQIDQASAAKCNAIVIEGLTSVHTRLVADELRKKPGAVGNEMKRCYIAASSHCKGLIDCIRQIKQNRIASGNGVPIFVALNTKSQSIDPDKPDNGDREVPDWSKNLIAQAMRGSDAHIQLMRRPTGTQLITVKSEGPHPFCKMRSAEVAEAVMRETNLNLPGLFTLWASEQYKKTRAVRKALDIKQEPNQTQDAQG